MSNRKQSENLCRRKPKVSSAMTIIGGLGRENAGMSNRKQSENLCRRKPKVSSAMTIIGGLGVPKRNPAPLLPVNTCFLLYNDRRYSL